jgi:hypothetical protein
MRARFRIGVLLGMAAVASGMALVPAAASATGSATGFAAGSAAGAATAAVPAPSTLSVVNVTVPGPVGHWQTCVNPAQDCITVPGITDLSVSAAAVVTGPALPTITLTSSPGCAGQVNVAAVVTPGLASGYLSLTIQYALADANGTAIPNSETTIVKSVPFIAGTPPLVVTECASEL